LPQYAEAIALGDVADRMRRLEEKTDLLEM
jgi:hypothetical protein